MKILLHPDPMLNRISALVGADEDVSQLVADMFCALYETDGIGLSAIQIGVAKRIFVIDLHVQGTIPYVFINPDIVFRSEEKITINEGCLSVPGYYKDVERSNKIILEANDTYGHTGNSRFSMQLVGLHAVCAQHEMDHLNGITLLG